MPDITLIVPVYKVESYLHRCVDSILSQTYSDFELLLVDDGSPDNCGRICDEYAEEDSRVHVIHQANQGLSAARNIGIEWAMKFSQSKWIGFIDSDDWVHNKYLEVLRNALLSTGCNISMCVYSRPELHQEGICVIPECEKWTADEAYSLKYTRDCYAYAWGRLYKKELFSEIRFPVGKIYEDIYTTYKIILKEQWVAVINCGLYYYFDNKNSITNTAWSPRMMDNFYSREELIHYLAHTNYSDLYKNNIKAYIYILTEQYHDIGKNKEHRKYKGIIKRRLRQAIHQYHNYFTIRDVSYAYDVVYPLYARIYWKFGK